jgi:glycosyltransferase involved in cell wall biosynthesis/SAM-dependent methyltransferase
VRNSNKVEELNVESAQDRDSNILSLETITPLISVIIPVYNGSKYIQQAIDSVLNQTYTNYEIIVIDDGSTDGTREKLQPYRSKIRYLYQENQGSAAARNLGIELAKGELIAFLDSDDYWYTPEKLEKQVAYFNENPSLGCINTGWRIVDGAGQHIKTVQPWHKAPKLDLETWLRKKCVRTSAMVFRKEWLEKVGGFDEELRQSHDVDLMLRLSLMGCETVWLKEETVCYRQHEENTTKNSLKQAKYVQAVLDKFFSRDDLPRSISQMESQIRYHTLVWIAWYQYRAGNLDEMAKFLQKSLNYTPYLRVENIAHWLNSFQRFSKERGEEFDIYFVTDASQWQKLVALILGLPVSELELFPVEQAENKQTANKTIGVKHSEDNNASEPKINQNNEQIQTIIKKPKVAVISWDLSHNPAGRSFLLADMAKSYYEVELIGPIFSFYGNDIWSPLKNIDSNLTIKTFKVSNIHDFIEEVKTLAQQQKYDFVYVSKPRFPSLFLGMLIKQYSECPLILDIDDHELSFFKNQNKLSFKELENCSETPEFDKLYSEIWTRFSEELIPHADFLTVSNIALQHRYGGILVRHGRDEKIFDPKLYARKKIRQEFGYDDSDEVILFLGTPRPHKGIFRIADALEKIDDPKLALCIIGTINDQKILKRFENYQKARIDFHDNQPWERLPELIFIADLICILQEPNSAISEYQIPAKLTDAMAMNIPVIVTKVPPLLDLIAAKSVIAISEDDSSLVEAIEKFLKNKKYFLSSYLEGRPTFLSEFSYKVNGERINQALQMAEYNSKPLPDVFYEVSKLIERKTNKSLGISTKPKDHSINTNKFFSDLIRKTPFFKHQEPLNILFFWKQNDSDIYGRRQDMIVKYLAKNERINKIIHFDAPMSVQKLQKNTERESKAKFSQNNLVVTNTIERFLKLKDTSKIIKRTFIYRERDEDKLLGHILPPKSEYPDFVRQVIKESGINHNTIAWVCPVNFEFPLLHQELNFRFVVAEIIDDQRQWDVHPNYAIRLQNNYQQILSTANTVFTNCEPVKQSFQEFNKDITIVPNGAEVLESQTDRPKPEELDKLRGSIIGYVGNLSDRIDIELLKYIAIENKNWNIVLIGSVHSNRNTQVFELEAFENIHLLGVKPYDEALSYITHFDVAIIPHLNNKLTKHMNPLKLYVYFSAGVPIVSSEIANIEEFSESISVANNPQDFVKCIKQYLDNKNIVIDKSKRNSLLQKINWQSRVNKILDVVDSRLLESSCSLEANKFQILDKSKDNTMFDGKSLQIKKVKVEPNDKVKLQEKQLSYDGVCNLCGTEQTFIKKHLSLREGYQCSNCQASLRYRGQASAILNVFGNSKYSYLADLCNDQDFRNLSIYEPGVIGPFRKYFANFSNYINSYFWSDVLAGDYKDGLQCQNLENLTYEDDLFDLVITSDIMEHVRHPWDAFKEIWRVLKPGGYYIFSIPVQVPMIKQTVYRVETSGDEDIHLVEPRYHSAPKPTGGRQESLVYVDFGQDIVEELESIGYEVEMSSPDVQNYEICKLITFVLKKQA